jgi:predicted enzyme related to lactoylglutathione lyase
MSKHPIVHVEISAVDRQASAQFYQELFGWQVKEFPEMNYTSFATGEDEVGGGFNPVNEENPAGTIMIYINTDDIAASLRQVDALGGKALMQPMQIPGVGLFATFKDPAGNTLALLQPDPM